MADLKRGIQAKSHDTLIVENRLRKTEEGDLVTYDDLSTLLGRDVRKFGKGCIVTARKTLIAESVFFDVIPREGLKRITQEEACNAADSYLVKTRNAASRGMKHLQNVAFDKLSEQGQKKHLTTSAQLGAVQMFSSAKAAKRIEAKTSNSQLALGDTLKLFGG